MSKRVFRVFLVAFLAGSLRAEWESIGKMTAPTTNGNRIIFRNRKTVAIISVLAPDLIRVRVARTENLSPDYSWAVARTDWPSIPLRIIKERTRTVIRTSALEVRAQHSPFRIAFHEPGGRLILQDAREPSFEGSRVRCWKEMPSNERYYGLGEKTGPLQRNGRSTVLWNTDPSGYDANTDPMYKSVPFFLALRQGKAYGIFFDNTHRSSYDFGAESPNVYSFGAEGGELNYYFFWGPDPKTILARYTELTGRAELPPLWGLGYIQSSMHYYPESVLRAVAENFRKRRIPCDALFLDNVHMDGYRVFTWDESGFPDPRTMLSDLRQQGFRVIAITNPGVKAEKGYGVYEQGVAGDHFLRRKNKEIYTGIMWPGESVFPDFTSEKTRKWWGSLFGGLIRDGISGFLADMNEPTVNAVPMERGWIPRPLDSDVVFYDNGLKSEYAKSHNVYGKLMAEAVKNGLLRYRPLERPFVITRATYAGGQRDGAQWTGDGLATWEDLRAGLRAMLSMGISGLPFTGTNVGGFIGMPTAELYARWLQLGVFSPFFWTHSALEQPIEPWSFGEPWETINRRTIELRYRLLPYLYNAFYESSQTGLPIMRALLFNYPDDEQAMAATPDRQNNEFLFGNDILIAPVVREGETERVVYLPKGVWYDFWTEQRYAGPQNLRVSSPKSRIPLFVKGGAIIPTRETVEYVDKAPLNPLIFEIYPDGDSSRTYYEDDGISFEYRKGVFLRRRLNVTQRENSIRIEATPREGGYSPPPRSLLFKIHGQETLPQNIVFNDKVLKILPSIAALEKTAMGAVYDPEARILWLKTPDVKGALAIEIQK